MNLFRILIALCISAVNWANAFGQIRPLEKYPFDSTYKIVGLPNLHSTIYKKYSFILENPEDMKALQNTIVLEKKTDKVFELQHFTIYIIKSNEILQSIIINPSNNNIPVNGEYFEFDFSLIRNLSKKFPLKFTAEETTFLTKREYESYREGAQTKPKFLFYFPAQFRYEGTFDIVINKSDSIQSPKQATEILRKEFYDQKLGPVNIIYVVTQENLRNLNRLVMQVETSKKVFDLYKPNGSFRKREWMPTKIVMTSIWKK